MGKHRNTKRLNKKRRYTKRRYTKRRYTKRLNTKNKYKKRRYSRRNKVKKLIGGTLGARGTVRARARARVPISYRKPQRSLTFGPSLIDQLQRRNLRIFRHFMSNGFSQIKGEANSFVVALALADQTTNKQEPTIYFDDKYKRMKVDEELLHTKTTPKSNSITFTELGTFTELDTEESPVKLCIFTSPFLRTLETTLEVLASLITAKSYNNVDITIIIGPFTEVKPPNDPFTGNKLMFNDTFTRFMTLIQMFEVGKYTSPSGDSITPIKVKVKVWLPSSSSFPNSGKLVDFVAMINTDQQTHLEKGYYEINGGEGEGKVKKNLFTCIDLVLQNPEVQQILSQCDTEDKPFPILVVSHSNRIKYAFDKYEVDKKLPNGGSIIISEEEDLTHQEKLDGWDYPDKVGEYFCTYMGPKSYSLE